MTEREIEQRAEQAADKVEEGCAPGQMSRSEAVRYLDQVVCRLISSLDALHEEIAAEE